MRLLIWRVILVATACSSRSRDARVHVPPSSHDAGVRVAPVTHDPLRLPAGVTPLAYDLRLEVDPDREAFAGRVVIRVRLDASVDRVSLHAVALEIASARWRAGASAGELTVGPTDEREIRVLGLGREVPAGELELELEYTGHAGREAEGLFRQRADDKWFLYSQSQSVFARRIVPCFDEPGYKASWRVTLVVPEGQIALANAPLEGERVLPDRRRELRFAEIGSLPPYLLAIAVGPFWLIEAGKVGRRGVPVRIAVAPSDAKRASAVGEWTRRLVDALERYVDRPLPLAKLDLVAVPRFFGAMENSGLITFETATLLGDARDPVYVRKLVRFLAHELAHQWFGNAATPVWWNDLWLSEAFATWLDDKLAVELGGLEDGPLRTQLARARALERDRELDVAPIRRAFASPEDIEDAFDEISYEKGAAVIEMFEDHIGEDAFRRAVRAYLDARGGGAATTADFTAALERVSSSAVARAFAALLDQIGAPVVDVAIACDPTPTVTLAPRAILTSGAPSVPVCVRYPGRAGTARACALVTGPTQLPLSEARECPAWIVGNADGRGYFHTHVRGARAPLAQLSAAEKIARGHDLAAALARGELPLAEALTEIRDLAGSRDPYAELAALALARELDPIVEGSPRREWSRWLATRFASRLTRAALFDPKTPVERALRDELGELVPGYVDRTALAAARELVERVLRGAPARAHDTALAVAIAAPVGGKPMFERIVALAVKEPGVARRDRLLEHLGAFGPELASRAVEVALDSRFRPASAWAAVAGMLARGDTRGAAWAAVQPRLPAIIASFAAVEVDDVIAALSSLCEVTSHAEVAAAVAPHTPNIAGGSAALGRALRSIDHCVARRAVLGDVPAALSAVTRP